MSQWAIGPQLSSLPYISPSISVCSHALSLKTADTTKFRALHCAWHTKGRSCKNLAQELTSNARLLRMLFLGVLTASLIYSSKRRVSKQKIIIHFGIEWWFATSSNTSVRSTDTTEISRLWCTNIERHIHHDQDMKNPKQGIEVSKNFDWGQKNDKNRIIIRLHRKTYSSQHIGMSVVHQIGNDLYLMGCKEKKTGWHTRALHKNIVQTDNTTISIPLTWTLFQTGSPPTTIFHTWLNPHSSLSHWDAPAFIPSQSAVCDRVFYWFWCKSTFTAVSPPFIDLQSLT